MEPSAVEDDRLFGVIDLWGIGETGLPPMCCLWNEFGFDEELTACFPCDGQDEWLEAGLEGMCERVEEDGRLCIE